jgi:hypothetical protein
MTTYGLRYGTSLLRANNIHSLAAFGRQVARFIYTNPAFMPSARNNVPPLQSATHLFQSVIRNVRDAGRCAHAIAVNLCATASLTLIPQIRLRRA